MLCEVLVQLPRVLPAVVLQLVLLRQGLSEHTALMNTLLLQLKVGNLRAAVVQPAGGMLFMYSTPS
jgi:hypothetical protein